MFRLKLDSASYKVWLSVEDDGYPVRFERESGQFKSKLVVDELTKLDGSYVATSITTQFGKRPPRRIVVDKSSLSVNQPVAVEQFKIDDPTVDGTLRADDRNYWRKVSELVEGAP